MSISVGGRLLLVKAGSLAQKRTLQNRESEARRVLEAKKNQAGGRNDAYSPAWISPYITMYLMITGARLPPFSV